MLQWFNGLGGTVHGSFFRVSDSVDTSKPPGASNPPAAPQTRAETLQEIFTGRAFFYSPNLSWFLLTCLVWSVAPYQLQKSWQENLKHRLMVNHLLVFTYVGFWHAALYWWRWAKRPFVPNRPYSWEKVLHNMFYTWLGMLQWTATEVAFIHCYQTNRIPHVENFSSSHFALLQTALASILVPPYRDVHFYFTHRLLHTNFLYKYIHSLHHRNSDIEPFSGLCMHPVEHLYYFTCHAPCLFLRLPPFILFWMGVHTVISPAASHSGYEDHFSADLMHYLHHRYSDCNYGAGVPFDRWFGTYQTKLKNTSNMPPKDPKATLGIVPENSAFNVSCLILGLGVWVLRDMLSPFLVALLLSTGPCWVALYFSFDKKQSLLAPFDKDSNASLVLHVSMGTIFGILPATYLIKLVL